mmetsp:Transcript_1754/g.3123  ORF Transcript_1754/g.3123 Transcript_1754/m.3123 type:complete len:124 (-) Transcript_1754:128-499(-)
MAMHRWMELKCRFDEVATSSDGGSSFPGDIVWGSKTSAYQIEGRAYVYTTGWPGTFVIPRRTLFLDGSSGDVACDHYHKMERDVEEILFKAVGLQAYRCSIAWPRILPHRNSTGPNPQRGGNY